MTILANLFFLLFWLVLFLINTIISPLTLIIFDFLFSNNFSKTWILQQSMTVMECARISSCKGYCKREGLDYLGGGFFLHLLHFCWKITVMKCSWTHTLKCQREKMHVYISELSRSLAKKPRNTSHHCRFSVPLNVIFL